MDFLLNESQKIFQKTMRDFCEKEIRPVIEKLDKEHLFSEEIYHKLVELGLPGIIYEEKYGGLDLDLMTLVLAMEEISRLSLGMAMAQGWVLYRTIPIAWTLCWMETKMWTRLIAASSWAV